VREQGRKGRVGAPMAPCAAAECGSSRIRPSVMAEWGPDWHAVAAPGQGHVSSAPCRTPRECLGLVRGNAAPNLCVSMAAWPSARCWAG